MGQCKKIFVDLQTNLKDEISLLTTKPKKISKKSSKRLGYMHGKLYAVILIVL